MAKKRIIDFDDNGAIAADNLFAMWQGDAITGKSVKTPASELQTFFSALNFYNSDGVLSGDRTVDGNSYSLAFNNVDTFKVASNSIDIYSYFFAVNQNYAALGDLNNDYDGTKIEVFDSSKTISSSADITRFQQTFTGNPYLIATPDDFFIKQQTSKWFRINNKIQSLGDIDNEFNGTLFTLDDTVQTATLKANNSSSIITNNFSIKDVDGRPWFTSNLVSKQIYMGDLGYAGNSTKFWIDDSNEFIGAKADNGFGFKASADPTKFYSIFKTEFLTDNDVYLQIPNANNKTLVVRVNNNYANSAGHVTIDIPAAQVPSDWNAATGAARILNKPTLPTSSNSSYTPSFSSYVNIGFVNAAWDLQVSRQGNTITLFGTIAISLASGFQGNFRMSLPIPAAETGVGKCGGGGNSRDNNSYTAIIPYSIVDANTALIHIVAPNTNSVPYTFTMVYKAA